jgi:prefoldin subunit 5
MDSSQLQLLHARFAAIDGGIRAVEGPIGNVDTVLGDTDKLLKVPQDVDQALQYVEDVLTTVQDTCGAITWVPEVGEAAASVSEALEPLVSEPPPSGAIGEMRKATRDIDETVVPIRKKVERIEKPIARTQHAINDVHATVAALETTTETLIRRYGNSPPASVETCASKLNTALATVADAVHEAKDTLLQRLQPVGSALSDLRTDLQPLAGYAETVDAILRKLQGRTFRSAWREVEQLKAKIEKYKHWAKAVVEAVMHKMGIPVKRIEQFLSRLEGSLDVFKRLHLEQKLQDAEEAIEAQVARVPGVQEFLEAEEKLEQALQRLGEELDTLLATECGKELFPGVRPPSPQA